MTKAILHFFLGKWFFILYFLLGITCFVILPLGIGDVSPAKSGFLTLALMTGSDPYSLKDTIESCKPIWSLAWIIHTGSWLLIPALIGVLINGAAEDIKSQRRLQIALKDLFEELGVKPEDIPELSSEVSELITEFQKKGEPS